MQKASIEEIIICSSNKGKLREFQEIAMDNDIVFKSIAEVYEDNFDPEETGSSFLENALIKARAGAELTNKYCLSDDSGIEIDALDGRPGIYAGRYLKQKDGGIEGVLKEIGDNPNRRCRFVCCIVIVDAEGELVFKTENYWYGNISSEAKGTNGFGYDPIVCPDEHPDKTVAELGNDAKNQLSHRAQALKEVLGFLTN